METDSIDCVKNRIEAIIRKSKVPEDPVHSKNTLKWVLKLKPNADVALQIAALGHDIERAIEEKKVKRKDFESYNEFKKEHAVSSVKILERIMMDCGVNKDLIEDVCSLVIHHEVGGDGRSNILKDADSLSFLDVNLPYYFSRNDVEETRKRILWSYQRLTDNSKRIASKFTYSNKQLDILVQRCIENT